MFSVLKCLCLCLYHCQPFTKVVVAKFPMGSVAVADMLALGKPFGTIVKHLIFPFKVKDSQSAF